MFWDGMGRPFYVFELMTAEYKWCLYDNAVV